MAKEYIDHGINVIIESYIPTEQIANRYLSLAKRKDVKLFYYQLEAPLRIRAKRIKQRPLAEGAKKKMTLEHIQRNDKFYLANKYSKALVIQTHNLTPVQVVRLILKDIASGSVKVEDKESKYKPKFVKDVFSGIREKATFEYKGRGSFLRQLRKIGTKRSV
jgi:cytidylate kinase